MKKITKMGALVMVAMLVPSLAFAASPWAGQGTYSDQVRGKLDFGVKNLLAGWTELFTKPMDYAHENKNVIKGFGHGLYNAVTFTVGGLLHTATFPVTQLDVPLPDNGVDF